MENRELFFLTKITNNLNALEFMLLLNIKYSVILFADFQFLNIYIQQIFSNYFFFLFFRFNFCFFLYNP